MTAYRRAAILWAVCAAVIFSFASCASGPTIIPAGLSAAEIFQRAQDASDHGNYPLGIRYYSLIPSTYPDDVSHRTWALYEIAFLYHKMGRNDTALSLIKDLLAKYDKEGDTLPPAPRVLAAKLKPRLEAMLQKKK